MARVTVSVNVRDMTGGDLARLRSRFNSLAQSMNRFSGNSSQANMDAMRSRFRDMSADVQALAGHIPHDEFERLNRRVQEFGAQTRVSFGTPSVQRLGAMRQSLREINNEMTRLNRTSVSNREVRITARDDTNRGLQSVRRRLLRFAAGPARGIGGLIGGTLSDGIGQGLVGAFKSPAFGSLIVVALAAALSMVGAAVAGALVFALGAAFVGLGVMIALQADGVREKWAKTLEGLKPLFQDAAKPLIPVIEHARVRFNEMAREFVPHFKEAMEQAGPTLNGFIDATKEGFKKMGQHAWDDLQEAFRVFVTAFGPEWEDFLSEFGKSLGALSRTVTEHSGEIAMALRLVLGVINLLLDAINFLANAWAMGIQFMLASTAALMNGFGMVLDGFLGMVDGMLGGLESVASLLGMDDEVAAARAAFNEMRAGAVEQFTAIADKATQMGIDIDNANKKRILEVDIASWNTQLTAALAKLKTVPPSQQTELRGEISDLRGKINAANEALRAMQKDYYVRIHAYKVGDWAIGLGAPGQAHGGVRGLSTAATGGARSNMTMVGESGPEIVNLPPGSHVRSNSDTNRILGQGGQGGGAQTLVLKSSGSRIDDLLIEILRDAIHDRGGNPVTVLGG